MLKLWDGVPAMDMSKDAGMRSFVLRSIFLWTIHDFPALGLVSGQQVKGYRGGPICMEDTDAEHAPCLHKMVYLGHRRYLPEGHRWRHARRAFNGEQEFRPPPRRRIGEEIREYAESRVQFLQEHGLRVDSENNAADPVKIHGVKRRSVLFDLPYWEVSSTGFNCYDS
jgi:hypothetical protein